jgi:hypothetical protein
MTTRLRTTDRSSRPSSFRKDVSMLHIELRLAEIERRQRRLRSDRDAERALERRLPPLRLQLGQSLVRLGRRIGGDAMSAPAWQG